MLKNSGPFLFLIIFFNFFGAYAQGKLEYFKEFKLKNGIYLTIEEFRNNNPSLPLSAVVNEDKDYLESSLCMRKLEYIENGEIFELKAKDVWGICINGEPYIKHVINDAINAPLSKPCFYKLYAIGSISQYFVQQREANKSFLSNNHQYNNQAYTPGIYGYSNSPKKLKIQEYALDMETGTSYNKKTNSKDIIAIIKSDDFFKDQKIKKKELGIFITNYNKRHPFSISTE